MKHSIFLFALFCLIGSDLVSADQWQAADGNHTIEADFVQYSQGMVTLKNADGAEIVLPIYKLHLRSQLAVIEKALIQAGEKIDPPAAAPQKEPERIGDYIEVTGILGDATFRGKYARGEFETVEEHLKRIKNLDGKEILLGTFHLMNYDLESGIYKLMFYPAFSADRVGCKCNLAGCVFILDREDAQRLKSQSGKIKFNLMVTVDFVDGKYIMCDPYVSAGGKRMKFYQPYVGNL